VLQYLPYPVRGTDHSAVHLAQHLYDLLVDEAEFMSGAEVAEPGPRRVGTVVATVPTTILPQARQRLKALVARALGLDEDDVVTDFDEATAAGMYFVMRDLSANRSLGLEALRASSRSIEPGRVWERTILVVDIGGGSTGVALLQVRLSDTTNDLTPEQAFLSGRTYELAPKLVGSTGDRQLGGDLLTLQVFYWIKARLIDEFGLNRAEEPLLALLLVDQAEAEVQEIVGHGVRDVLDEYLPTRTGGRAAGTDLDVERRVRRFAALWRCAEIVKRRLGEEDAPEMVVLGSADIAEVLDSGGHRLRDPVDETLPDVVLNRDQFCRLIRPVLRHVGESAYELVDTLFRRQRAARPGSAPVLDQIVLSGQTTTMPEVRAAVVSVFGENDPYGEVTGWRLATLAFERGFLAKQATSIGAAWIQSMRMRSDQTEDKRGSGNGIGGVSELTVDVRGLLPFLRLPCDFAILRQGGGAELILESGEPFRELDAHAPGSAEGAPLVRIGARTDAWRSMTGELLLMRPVSRRWYSQWGGFQIARWLRRAGLDQFASVWDLDQRSPLRYQIEVDDQLTPTVLLCVGSPRRLVVQRQHVLIGLSIEPGIGEEADTSGLRGRVCVSADGPDDGVPRLAELFPERDSRPFFTELFHDSADAQAGPRPGRIARVPIAAPPDSFYFYLDRDASRPECLGRLQVPPRARQGLEDCYHATLDASGRLGVVPGEVPFLPAADLHEVERRPGCVLRLPMDLGDTDFNPYWDAFSGRH
jgi:hypothetical protein